MQKSSWIYYYHFKSKYSNFFEKKRLGEKCNFTLHLSAAANSLYKELTAYKK